VGDGRVPVDHDVLVAHGLPRWSSGIDDGDGDDDQGDEEPEPVASSTSDATGRDARQASVPPRRVRAGGHASGCRHGFRTQTPTSRRRSLKAEQGFPKLRQVVLDCTDARELAEFYRQLLDLRYRPGDEPPAAGQPDPAGQEWLILLDGAGSTQVAFQPVAALPKATWPEGPIPQQLHLDLTVPTTADLDIQHELALALGARLLEDRSDDPEESLRVYADPAGHPFCVIVAN
jgi:hypothetical protein